MVLSEMHCRVSLNEARLLRVERPSAMNDPSNGGRFDAGAMGRLPPADRTPSPPDVDIGRVRVASQCDIRHLQRTGCGRRIIEVNRRQKGCAAVATKEKGCHEYAPDSAGLTCAGFPWRTSRAHVDSSATHLSSRSGGNPGVEGHHYKCRLSCVRSSMSGKRSKPLGRGHSSRTCNCPGRSSREFTTTPHFQPIPRRIYRASRVSVLVSRFPRAS